MASLYNVFSSHLWYLCPISSFLPSLLTSFITSFLHSFLYYFLHSFLYSFLPSFLPLFLPSFITSFLYSFLPLFPPFPPSLFYLIPSLIFTSIDFYVWLISLFYLFFIFSTYFSYACDTYLFHLITLGWVIKAKAQAIRRLNWKWSSFQILVSRIWTGNGRTRYVLFVLYLLCCSALCCTYHRKSLT